MPVLVTLSVQSHWMPGSVPAEGVPTTAVARTAFIEQFRSDISAALRINEARVSVSAVQEDASAAAGNLTAHSNSGFAYVLVTFALEVPAGGDSARDPSGADYSSTLLLTFVDLMLAEPHSQLYQGVYTASARRDSLVALNGAEYHGSLPWPQTTTGTAVIFFSCVCVLLLLVLWLVRASPPSARAFDLATLVLAITSTVTNALFIRWLHERRHERDGFEAAYWLSLACMALPPIPIAVLTVVQIVKQSAMAEPCGVVRDKSDGKRSRAEKPGPVLTLHAWMSDHTNVIVLACLLSTATSIDCLAIITSRILWKPAFSAPWSQCVKFTTKLGLISVLFRSAPQLVVQVWVTQATDNWSNLQVLSIAASGMTVLVGLLVRGLTICLAKSVPVAQAPQQIQILPREPKLSDRWGGALQAVTAGGSAHTAAAGSAASGAGADAAPSPQVSAGRILGQRPPVVVRVASIVALSIAVLAAQGGTLTHAALSSGPAGHLLSTSLQVFGNVSVVDGSGGVQNLLDLIQQQQAVIAQQSSALSALTSRLSSAVSTRRVRTYSSSSSYVVPSDLLYCVVEVVGGGGGGGGTAASGSGYGAVGGGGGGGGYSQKTLTIAALSGAGSVHAITVGAGGSSGAAGGGSGGTGGTSSFGSFLSASGGTGGQGGTNSVSALAAGWWGGTGSGGDINIDGGAGGNGFARDIYGTAGFGGSSALSGQTRASPLGGNFSPGFDGRSYGGGGSGAACANTYGAQPGGAGAAGIVIVTELVAVP